MKSAKSLKKIAVKSPRQVGKPKHLKAVKCHLLSGDDTEQIYASDAAVKLAYAEPHTALKIRDALESVVNMRPNKTVVDRIQRAMRHIDSSITMPESEYPATIEDNIDTTNEDTKLYRGFRSSSNINYCSACGTELPTSGPVNYCPGCGNQIS